MKDLTTVAITLLVSLSLILVSINGCGVRNMNKANNLKPVEVKEYKGEKLSSVNDFRENSIKGPQHIDLKSYQLKISGLVKNPKSHTYDEVINQDQHYQKVVTLNCVEGWSVTILWEGLLVNDLIKESNPLPNAKVVIFHAYDGYTTSLPLDYIVNNNILMAYKMNEITIPPEMGFPFQLVAESKWGYKWIKWITDIELSDNISYRGYWESNGYSNSANLSEDFFEP